MSIPVPSSDALLEARGLSVVYNTRKVLDIDCLQIQPNKVTAIIGPNGSGKTTLSLCLALLTKPTTGDIYYKGSKISLTDSAQQMRRKFAVVFQEPLLLNNSVIDNVSLGLKLRGVERRESEKRVHYWLDRFGIASLAKRSARTLSGGEAQRTSLARAFVLQPEVLFLDEPFAALDVPTRQSLFGDMMNILKETACTTVLVTHDRSEAQTLANRIFLLMNGKIAQSGSPREIFSTPANEDIAKFVGMENVLEGSITANLNNITDICVADRTVEGISGYSVGEAVSILIRPEDITISKVKSSSSARNSFSGRIVRMIPDGPLVRLSLDCGFPLTSLITRMSWDELQLEIGSSVFASFKATAIHVIRRC